ncbi:histidine phosphatase family protein [Effusibacillus dendaii]|uniref:Phosphoglycerate mutase n=1 Tax=Effusibacillus dendaii TaxID=2743772 RepID=A0A7I8DAT5_9BACL|nr:histidine phosphatase family protein [Effusibacillus dendaii]BCJ85936.1 phosphoglycerate mutase [Effusibacillus dendaii]
MMTEICLVRHGETAWNREARMQGSQDTPLSEVGIRQARIAAAQLAKESWDVIYSSDLSRAKHTAEEANEHLQIPHYVEKGLRERSYGILEGMIRSDIEQMYPGVFSGETNHEIAGLESFESLSQRVKDTIETIARRHPGQRILIFTHGGTINAFLHAITGQKAGKIGNTAITRVRFDNQEWYVDCVNDCSHLTETPVE